MSVLRLNCDMLDRAFKIANGTQMETMVAKKNVLPILAVLIASSCSQPDVPLTAPQGAATRPLASTGSSPVVRSATVGNCTLTQGFWKNHPSAWPVDELVLGGTTYSKAEALTILDTPPRGDATYILIDQLIAATLSVANGADPSALGSTLADANAWLQAHPLGSKPTGDDRNTGVALAAVLDSYNNGVTGPGHCGDATPVATPTATETPTAPPPPPA
jgi:hypothetical protein